MSDAFDPKNCRVALLAGGISKEREVSLSSGKGAQAALEKSGFQVEHIDPAYKKDLVRLLEEDFDVAFICLHGKYGEDGTMQGFLDIAGIPYIGSGVWASSVAMDKAKAKVFYEKEGIKTPVSFTVSKENCPKSGNAIDELMQDIGAPCIVKPATEGSAVGVFIVGNSEELEEALTKALELDKEVLVESYIKGKELTVAVVGNKEVTALPIIEIVPRNEFYDYDAKYAPGGSEHICPAELSDHTTQAIQNAAMRAHRILGCRGMSRSDFILDDNGQAWILETNTIPGMTETSLLPDAGRAAGIQFPEFCRLLIELALEKE